ncbi:T9SS type A sorting domain-containing protein [Flavobacterium cerinum]|uniref:T9SS type A sorting domain-containing protein n=2 Tax=Flavobacterium cerinum TaxID=2502784 RepID=A0A3S3TVL9_9FLAO|nr:T9SS type A sorting domain-containing protein [Flavobacterium cerinum]
MFFNNKYFITMKKFLLSAVFASCFITANAQELQAFNFNDLTVGNVTTDIAGTAAGQGLLYLVSANGAAPTTSTNANVSNAQIVSTGGANLKTLKIDGPDGDKGGRFLYKKDALPTAWIGRTAGNNTIEIEFEINPGGATTSVNDFGVYVYNADATKVLVGVSVKASTKVLSIVGYSTPTGQPVGNYNYTFGTQADPVKLPADQWSKIKISFNKTTGEMKIIAPGLPAAGNVVPGSAAGLDPDEVDVVSFAGSRTGAINAASATMHFDNIVVKAVGGTTGKEDFAANSFSVYPNPANDILNIDNTVNALMQDISIVDMNGRTVKTVKLNGESSVKVTISDLTTGIYMMNIQSDKGAITKKIIKN